VTVAPRPVGNNEKFVMTVFGSEPGGADAERSATVTLRSERANAETRARVPSPASMGALPPLVFGFGPMSLAVAGADIPVLTALDCECLLERSDNARSVSFLSSSCVPGILHGSAPLRLFATMRLLGSRREQALRAAYRRCSDLHRYRASGCRSRHLKCASLIF